MCKGLIFKNTTQVTNQVFIVFMPEEILLDTNTLSISALSKNIGLLYW